MTIREELAKTLKAAFWRTTSHKPTEDFNDHWYRTADECLRQMEWAQRQQMKYLNVEPVKCGTEGCGCEIGLATLTLAPPDWKP